MIINKNQRIKHKLSNELTINDLRQDWTQCMYLLKNKHRLCNMGRAQGSQYCGIHRTNDEIAIVDSINLSKRTQKFLSNSLDRMDRLVCPIDPSHSIYKHNLNKHLTICNKQAENKLLASLSYYKYNCNVGSNDTCYLTNQSNESIDKMNIDNYLINLIKKIKLIYESIIINDTITNQLPIEVTNQIRSELSGDQTSFNRLRHVQQDIQIVEQIVSNGFIDLNNKSNQTMCIELGAGRGMLGLALSIASPDSTIIMIERSGVTRKADKSLRKSNRSFARIRMDLSHCYLPGLPGLIDSNKIIAVAKHLCGSATDYAIRSLKYINEDGITSRPRRCVAIATCCHHCCDFNSYVGKQWISSHGIDSNDFKIIISWSGWATLDRVTDERLPKPLVNELEIQLDEQIVKQGNEKLDKQSVEKLDNQIDDKVDDKIDETVDHKIYNHEIKRPSSLNASEMREIGFMCKRIIDHGRIEYLQTIGITSQQVRYCDESLSPECYLIIGQDTK